MTRAAGGLGPPPPPVCLAALLKAAMPREVRVTPEEREVSGTFVVQVSFCVTERGRTKRVRVIPNSGVGRSVESLCRTTVEMWRFRPFVEDGRASTTCTITHFQLHL